MQRRNGNRAGITAPGFMQGTFTAGSSTSAIKEYTHPGDSILELLMRSNFLDRNERNAFHQAYSFAEEFGLEKRKEELLAWLAGSDSINAQRMDRLTEALTGHFKGEGSKQKSENIWGRLKKRLGGDGNSEPVDDEE